MRLALLSDIHANLHALDACLAHAAAQGVTRFAVLGDVVGYGAFPAEVTQRVMALAAQGAAVVQGNHDQYAVAPPPALTSLGHISALWTHQQLGDDERAFLATRPLTHHDGALLLVHASADAPTQWRYVNGPARAARSLHAARQPPRGDGDVRYVFGGHVHMQTLYLRGPLGMMLPVALVPGTPVAVPDHRQWIGTVGSVGQPRDGNCDAMYTVLDEAARQLTFHRVPYDVQAAADAIRATPLPAFFADRLITGE
ncbi:MAG: metallophosphoesterase family protein [Pseudomonadota bacterium]|nr:metallophosphoesterase family protein [Pseudomonadota bacterium]